jgi:hypothetical protein
VSSTVLRRDLVNLISEVKKSCSHKVSKTTDGSKLVEKCVGSLLPILSLLISLASKT